jgi:thioredoxin 1
MKAIELNDRNFNTEVMQSDKPVLVDFWAPWCGPCRMMGPVIEEIAAQSAGNVKVAKVNVDEQPSLAQQFGVMSIPTLVVIKHGRVTATSVGAQPKQSVLRLLER